MYKNLSIVALCVLFMAGCGKKNVKKGGAAAQNKGQNSKKKMFFDENVDAFVLEEDQNPFGFPENQPGIRLLSEDGTALRDHEGEFEVLYYGFDQAEIRSDQEPMLKRTIEKIRAAVKAGKTVVIEGHACKSAGSASYNMMLSEKRAEVVRKACIKAGIPASKLKVVGRGSEMCKVACGNCDQQAPNRRVEAYTLAADAA